MNICLTIDADWAPPQVLSYAVNRVNEVGISFTLFATDILPALVPSQCEIAWHPNLGNGDYEVELNRLANLFPRVRGMRPHRLASKADDLLPLMQRQRIQWVSWSYRLHGAEPISQPGGILDFPVSWGDNSWFNAHMGPDLLKLSSTEPGYYVLTFHPVHLFLNTYTTQQYAEAKTHYQDASRLYEKRNIRLKGVDDVLSEVLDLCSSKKVSCLALSEAFQDFQNNSTVSFASAQRKMSTYGN